MQSKISHSAGNLGLADLGWVPNRSDLGWMTGLEPATPWTTTRCSTD